MARFRQLIACGILILFCSNAQAIYTNSDNRVISTIKPDGSGDFTTLQTWNDLWAKKQTNASQWAECYAGGSLGNTTLSGWTSNTPSATSYPRVYAAQGNRHDGQKRRSGAYIQTSSSSIGMAVKVSYMRIEGMCVDYATTNDTGWGIAVTIDTNCDNVVVDGNLIVGSSKSSGISVINQDPDIRRYATVRNNVVYSSGYTGGNYGYIFSDGGGYLTVFSYNNTVLKHSYGFYDRAWSPVDLTVTNYNSASLDSGSATRYIVVADGGTVNIFDRRYCASSDRTVTNWNNIGNGNLTNVVMLACVVSSNNATPAWNSPLLNKGTNVTFSTDALGRPRKWGSASDIGGIERSIRGAVE